MKTIDIKYCPLCKGENFYFLYNDYNNISYVKCAQCALVFQNPRVVIDYEKDYWVSTKDPDGKIRDLMSDEERKFKVNNRMINEIKYVNSLLPGKILDAGCGPGFFLAEINKEWGKYGIELSKFNVDYINDSFSDINVQVGSLEKLPYEDNFFDIVYSFQVMEHVFEPVKIFKEFSRVCKPDGKIIISTPNIDSFCSKRFKGNYRLLGAPHVIMWSPITMKHLFKLIGFEVVKEYYPFFKTEYFTLKNLIRLLNKRNVSPPFYGNEMNLYAKRISN